MSIDDTGGMGRLVARLNRGGQRLRHADRARPWVLDTGVVVVAVVMFCLPDLLPEGSGDDGPRKLRLTLTELPLAATLALQAGLVLPRLWRRSRPGHDLRLRPRTRPSQDRLSSTPPLVCCHARRHA